MPVLAGVYDVFDAASHASEQNAWWTTFFDKLATRLPLALILAIIVYGLVTAVAAILHRLHGVSVAAQAARKTIEREPKRSRHSHFFPTS
jgi:hypothetical protein